MQSLRFTIQPQSAFATPLMGDTLFGQLCWTIRHKYGDSRLDELLRTYATGKPFCVVSDGFPSGYIPRPSLPLFSMASSAEKSEGERKRWKGLQWMPLSALHQPVTQWLDFCQSAGELGQASELYSAWLKSEGRTHNSINSMTGTTGEGGFAPYSVAQSWYHPNALLDIYIQIDTALISVDELKSAFSDIGLSGYGKDASTGRGQFEIANSAIAELPKQADSNSWMVLSPCAPQGMGFNADKSYWQLFTRFGRHGSLGAISGQPFKNPVLLVRAGSVFTPSSFSVKSFLGQGLGGCGELSKAIPQTVHQGYAPVVSLNLAGVHKRIADACTSENE